MVRKKKSQPKSRAPRISVRKVVTKKKSSKRKSILLNQETKCHLGRSCRLTSKKNVCCKDLSDAELIALIQIQKKNKEAYYNLTERYSKKLFTYIFHFVGDKSETEDILQNVFSKTYKNLDKFDVSRKFSSWIYRIAHNESVNFLKRRNKRYSVSWEDISTTKDKLDTATNEEIPEEKWEHMEIVREIDEALEKLPPKYKQVLKFRYFQEYSYEEIGDILKKPINTIGTLINRAKKKLLKIAKQQGIKNNR